MKPARVGDDSSTTAEAGRVSNLAVVRPPETTNVPALRRVTSPGDRVGSPVVPTRAGMWERSPGTAARTSTAPLLSTAATCRRSAIIPTAGEA
ncbi:hypothetical protein EUA06_08135 [Nocardioides glacieisoli]|uniref:Uncharacterized protein n=1 Tax=Nocardioides glacieisoli TaxID=1168730 RepID=A0A4Q2RQQ0_9ACTN|nr:hypothetical protein EUA06_08135 [Nocardioides glacieisoli]